MTQQEFVDALRRASLDSLVSDLQEAFERPPGRKPGADLVALSKWYATLGPGDRQHLAGAMALAARVALFGALAVLDGVRSIEPMGEKGEFRLVFRKGGREWELSGPEMLHDLL